MHKNRLQELCHKRMWPLPSYTNSRDGPDHNPRFGASVVVNGQTFDAPSFSKSVKDAQNKVAEVALDHLSAIAPASAVPPNLAVNTEVQISYKAQLQQYVQKRNIAVLKYDSVREASAHTLRFKARVTIDEQTFDSSDYFNTIREAEHSAARVALMSLPLEDNHQDEPNFYKNLLQELVQKAGLSLPSYSTQCNGESHIPIFTCTVTLNGERFVGESARTKKQAEMNAAKVAWHHAKEQIHSHSIKVTREMAIGNLEQPKIHSMPSLSSKTEERNQTTKGALMKWQVKRENSSVTFKNQQETINFMDAQNFNSIPVSIQKINEDYQPREQKGLSAPPISNEKIEDKLANGGEVEEDVKTISAGVAMNEAEDAILSFGLSKMKLDSGGIVDADNSHRNSSSGFTDDLPLLKLGFDAKIEEEEEDEEEEEEEEEDTVKGIAAPSLLCNRVLVYPRKPEMILPTGATLLPFSDGAWVAVSLDFCEHEDNLLTML